MSEIPEDVQAEVGDLLDTVRVLRQGVHRAAQRHRELEQRLRPYLLNEGEIDPGRLEASGLDEIDVWLCAMADDLTFSTFGSQGVPLMVRDAGAVNPETYQRYGVPAPPSA